jgi:hypothetical protein
MTCPDAELDPDVLPPAVGLLLWRPAPGGRELLTLALGKRNVLPKGVLRPGEDEQRAARRLARDLCGALVAEASPLAPPPGGAALAWWCLRWDAPVEGQTAAPGNARRVWLGFDGAQVVLAQRFERELVRAQGRGRLQELRDWLDRPRRARARRARWELDDLRQRLGARPDAPAGPGRPSWRARALALVARTAEAQAEGDELAAADARAEALRLELHGSSATELGQRRSALMDEVEAELEGPSREAARALLNGPADANVLGQVAALVDARRARRRETEHERSQERRTLASVLALGLVAAWLFGSPDWYSSAAGGGGDVHLAVTIFGLLGGASSALLGPGRGAPMLPPMLRSVLGAVAAQLLYALLASGTVALVQPQPGSWPVLAFAAGFLERLFKPRA